MELVRWKIPAPSSEFRVIAIDGYRIIVWPHGTPGGPLRLASPHVFGAFSPTACVQVAE